MSTHHLSPLVFHPLAITYTAERISPQVVYSPQSLFQTVHKHVSTGGRHGTRPGSHSRQSSPHVAHQVLRLVLSESVLALACGWTRAVPGCSERPSEMAAPLEMTADPAENDSCVRARPCVFAYSRKVFQTVCKHMPMARLRIRPDREGRGLVKRLLWAEATSDISEGHLPREAIRASDRWPPCV